MNNLAAECKYSACCRDRLLRDTFVAGIRCSKILSSLLQDCEKKTFNEVVEKAKLLEQIRIDAEDIKSDPRGNNTTHKIKNESVKLWLNYVCIRCTTRGKLQNVFHVMCTLRKRSSALVLRIHSLFCVQYYFLVDLI